MFSISFYFFTCSRPLISTTPTSFVSSDPYIVSSTPTTLHPVNEYITTPIPSLHAAKAILDRKFMPSPIPLATLRVTMETSSSTASNQEQDDQSQRTEESEQNSEEPLAKLNELDENNNEQTHEESTHEADYAKLNDEDLYDQAHSESEEISEKVEETTSVEHRLKKISEEIEKYSNNDNQDIHGRQSFFSLSDLIKTLRPSDKKIIPQIDSDYSNTMHVLGETAKVVGGDDARKIKTIDLRQTNRALY